jgi:hypothetical protein
VNGPLEQIASPSVTVNPDGSLNYSLTAERLTTGPARLESSRLGITFTCWTSEESEEVAKVLTKLRSPEQPRKRKRSYKDEQAQFAIRTIYGDPIRNPEPTPGEMNKAVNKWLAEHGYGAASLKTIVEAARAVREASARIQQTKEQ